MTRHAAWFGVRATGIGRERLELVRGDVGLERIPFLPFVRIGTFAKLAETDRRGRP
jgi:hypothetical protein